MSNIPERKRVKHTGKGKGHSHIQLPHYILQSDEFGALTGNAIKLLLELASGYKGHNNGDLSCAYSAMKSRGWRSAGTLEKAKKELLDARWIVCTRNGGSHRCALYALTWWPLDECPGKQTMFTAENKARHDWNKNSLGTRYSDRSTRYSDRSARKVGETC